MIDIDVQNNLFRIRALCDQMGDALAPEISMGLNRAAYATRTHTIRELAKQRKIERAKMQDWKIKKSHPDTLEAKAYFNGERIGMDTLPYTASKTGVTVDQWGKKIHFKHGFVVKIFKRSEGDKKLWVFVPSKKPKVDYWERDGKKIRIKGRFPVSKLVSVRPQQIADDPEILEATTPKILDQFTKQVEHGVKRLVEEYG